MSDVDEHLERLTTVVFALAGSPLVIALMACLAIALVTDAWYKCYEDHKNDR